MLRVRAAARGLDALCCQRERAFFVFYIPGGALRWGLVMG